MGRPFVAVVLAVLAAAAVLPPRPDPVLRDAVAALVRLETPQGWPYEGVYRTGGQIPLPYRAGGTALVGQALMAAAPEDPAARAGADRAATLILGWLDDPALHESLRDAYDVRVWGQACALEFLCGRAELPTAPLQALVRRLLAEELAGGGWNYANRREPCAFVTAQVIRALLAARSRGIEIPPPVLSRARASLLEALSFRGTVYYGGRARVDHAGVGAPDGPAGSAGRRVGVVATLAALDPAWEVEFPSALDHFHRHWGALDERRARPGTHEGPYRIAPYYFCWAHRAAGWAARSAPERALLRDRILSTREREGTWNDRVFPASRAPCTALMVLALLGR